MSYRIAGMPTTHRQRAKELNEAGRQLEERLAEMGLTKADLVREMNRRRAALGIGERMADAMLWRWMTADRLAGRRINVDDAALIELICGLPTTVWSRYSVLFPVQALAATGTDG